MIYDVAIAGGGPAGLAAALEAAARGFSVGVFERREGPLDKACGEGLMPSGLTALERLGVLPHLDRRDTAPFESLTWRQQSGAVTARLPAPGGLGVRRVALIAALQSRAKSLGVELHERCAVRSHRITPEGVYLLTELGEVQARLLVAADGLHSPLRRAEGLERHWSGPRRFGVRRHAALAPWSSAVEVHFTDGAEAYVTPAGANRVGIAFLWEHGETPTSSFESLLARFPALRERLGQAPWDSEARGAGPLRQLVTRRVNPRFALLGDAAGYVDALTGEGLSLAFASAAALGRLLPDVLARHGSLASLAPYEQETRRLFARYSRLASLLVWTVRRPALRRYVIDRLIAHPRLFERALAHALV